MAATAGDAALVVAGLHRPIVDGEIALHQQAFVTERRQAAGAPRARCDAQHLRAAVGAAIQGPGIDAIATRQPVVVAGSDRPRQLAVAGHQRGDEVAKRFGGMADRSAPQVEQCALMAGHAAMSAVGRRQMIIARMHDDIAQADVAAQNHALLVFMMTVERQRGAGGQFDHHRPLLRIEPMDPNAGQHALPVRLRQRHPDEALAGRACPGRAGQQAPAQRLAAGGFQGDRCQRFRQGPLHGFVPIIGIQVIRFAHDARALPCAPASSAVRKLDSARRMCDLTVPSGKLDCRAISSCDSPRKKASATSCRGSAPS